MTHRDMMTAEFRDFLRKSLSDRLDLVVHTLTENDLEAVEALCLDRYNTWDWNWGRSPDYNITKRRRIEGVGAIRVQLQVENGEIASFMTDGGYMCSRPCGDIAAALRRAKLEESALRKALADIQLEDYYEGLCRNEFIRLILE
jgi:lipoate-protein ligase A